MGIEGGITKGKLFNVACLLLCKKVFHVLEQKLSPCKR